MTDDHKDETFISLPDWRIEPDPEIPGEVLWVYSDYDGDDLLVILTAGSGVSVIRDPLILPNEVDGEEIGLYPDWSTAVNAVLAFQEIKEEE